MHRRFLLRTAGLALALVAALPADADEPTPRGDRWLGLGVTDPQDHDYGRAFEEARAAGMRHLVLSFDWRDLETGPGEFRPDPNFLAIADAWYPPRATPVHLMIRPIHTNQDVRPAHLKDLPFDDPRVITAFRSLLDWVFAQAPHLEIPSLSIGSEIDIRLADDETAWRQYGAFLAEAAKHARARRPGLRIAAEATYAGVIGSSAARLRALEAACDVVGMSHYPITPESTVQDPGVVHEVFRTVRDFADGKPVFFYQLGYPSGAGCRSSEEAQARFIREVFAAWDAHAREIPFLNLTWTEEIPAASVEHYTRYYQFDAGAFREFLGTLGLRHPGGKPKAAWTALGEEARRRGW